MSKESSSVPIVAGDQKSHSAYLQHPSICAAELDGEICLFNPATATYLNLNGSASAIWNLIASKLSEDMIINSLLDVYEVDESTCIADVRVFLNQAIENGMVEVHPL